jgi:Putative peptidoglycan binding domain
MMLPAFMTSTKKFTTLAVTAALVTALATPPAMAWGDKEQNFLAGVAATLLVGGLIQSSHQQRPPAYVPPAQPTYYTPPTYSSIYQTPSATAFNSYSSNERKRIQSTLAAYGYYHGSIDGAFGSGTYNAVQAFATNTGKTSLMSTQAGAFTLYDGLLF